jgi:hypothetical protein
MKGLRAKTISLEHFFLVIVHIFVELILDSLVFSIQ